MKSHLQYYLYNTLNHPNDSRYRYDHIGQFLKVLGDKIPGKSSQNILQRFWAVVKNGTFYIKLMWILFEQILEKIWPTCYSNIWSHWI